jgi:hypothetical protein
MEAERLRKASIDAKNAPGGEAFIEKKRQLRDFLLTEFHISKTVGNPIREFVHKGSAYHAFSQYAPNGPRGLTISVQVNSEGNLALLAKYLGFTDADYNQLGVSFGESDLLTQPTRDMTRSPLSQSSADKRWKISSKRSPPNPTRKSPSVLSRMGDRWTPTSIQDSGSTIPLSTP